MLEQRFLDTYLDLFVHRRDVYAQQTRTGSYFLKTSPVTAAVAEAHLRGELTAGWYALDQQQTVRWVTLDADRPDGREQLQEAWKQLAERGIASQLELSRRGGHLWILFEPIAAKAARRLVLGVLPELEGIEVYPKRDQLDRSARVGNLLRGPLGIHRLTGKRYPLVDPISLNPVARSVVGTLEYLSRVPRISPDLVAEQLASLLDQAPLVRPEVASPDPASVRTRSVLQEIKRQLGDPYEFISRFMALDASGRGHCPFHPPDHHPSFAVNRQQGYWVDFHEVNPRTGRYVGGDVIEFYRKLRGLTYAEVLRELRCQLSSSSPTELAK
jgi:hypothetical protein